MSTLEIILSAVTGFMLILYITSKIRGNSSLSELISDVKDDLTVTAANIKTLVNEASSIVLNDNIVSIIKEFVMIVEQNNSISKSAGGVILTGEEKKEAVLERLSSYLKSITGSSSDASTFLNENEDKLNEIIDDYVSFANIMNGKLTSTYEEEK
jgi:hypothetical protein